MNKAQETILEIDFSALEHNYNHLKSKLQGNTKFLAVVKAFLSLPHIVVMLAIVDVIAFFPLGLILMAKS